jgi:SPP1 family predicted phage head-tail adaptor
VSIERWLNRTLEVWRPTTVPDGSGGQVVTLVQVGEVRAKVDQPSAAERLVAAQAGAEQTRPVYLLPATDVRRGDELRDGSLILRVVATVTPSTPDYLRADCTWTQPEGATP